MSTNTWTFISRTKKIVRKGKAEKYAKITAKTIISIGGADSSAMGQNAFFYDAAEGLLASLNFTDRGIGEKTKGISFPCSSLLRTC